MSGCPTCRPTEGLSTITVAFSTVGGTAGWPGKTQRLHASITTPTSEFDVLPANDNAELGLSYRQPEENNDIATPFPSLMEHRAYCHMTKYRDQPWIMGGESSVTGTSGFALYEECG